MRNLALREKQPPFLQIAAASLDGLITAEQAANDASFLKKGSNGNMYETTTMEDCCRPSCAAANWVQEKGLPVDPDYNVFYSCDRAGVPITEPEK